MRIQEELKEEKKTRVELFNQYTEVTGKRWNKNERRYNKLPEEFKLLQTDLSHTSMREALA